MSHVAMLLSWQPALVGIAILKAKAPGDPPLGRACEGGTFITDRQFKNYILILCKLLLKPTSTGEANLRKPISTGKADLQK